MEGYKKSNPKKLKNGEITIGTIIEKYPWGKVHSGMTKGSNKRAVCIKCVNKEECIKKKQVDLIHREIKFLAYQMSNFIVSNKNKITS